MKPRKRRIMIKVEYEDVMLAFQKSIKMYKDLIKVRMKVKNTKKEVKRYKDALKKKVWAMNNLRKYKKGYDIQLLFDGSYLFSKKDEK